MSSDQTKPETPECDETCVYCNPIPDDPEPTKPRLRAVVHVDEFAIPPADYYVAIEGVEMTSRTMRREAAERLASTLNDAFGVETIDVQLAELVSLRAKLAEYDSAHAVLAEVGITRAMDPPLVQAAAADALVKATLATARANALEEALIDARGCGDHAQALARIDAALAKARGRT